MSHVSPIIGRLLPMDSGLLGMHGEPEKRSEKNRSLSVALTVITGGPFIGATTLGLSKERL